MEQTDSKYLPELMAEKDSIDPSFEHAVRLISEEIDRIKNPTKETRKSSDDKDFLEVSGKPFKLEYDILVPADKYPSVNFVGRLIGPGGATMKGIQEMTNTKMAVLGKGSVREKDRKKAEELKDTDEKFSHMKYPLHVHISTFGPVPQAFINIARAAAEVQKILVVDEATEAQYGAQQAMANQPTMRGRGRGSRGGRGGNQNQRGFRGGRGSGQRGRGQGGRGGMRGRGRGQPFAQMQAAESYADDYSYDAYGMTGTAFDGSYDGYGDFDGSYEAAFGAEGYDGSYGEDYGGFGQESYDSFGNGATGGAAYGGQGSFRGKMRGGGGRGRQKPY